MLPLFMVGLAADLTTAWVEYYDIGARGGSFDLTALERMVLAGRAVCFYLSKLIWSSNLMFIYPRWNIDQGDVWQYAYAAVVTLVLVALWYRGHRSRAPFAAALCYCGLLFPAVGFFDVHPFRYSFVADHFQYLQASRRSPSLPRWPVAQPSAGARVSPDR